MQMVSTLNAQPAAPTAAGLVSYFRSLKLPFTFATKTMASVESRVKGASYEKVMASVSRLQQVVGEAIAADDAEYNAQRNNFLKSVLRGGVSYLFQRLFFERAVGNLRLDAKQLAQDVRKFCEATMSDKASTPNDLRADAAKWQARRAEVADLIDRARELQQVPGCEGRTMVGYAQAVQVQASAMNELAGVMESASQSCNAGAILNEAVFCVAQREIDGAIGRIAANAPSDGLGVLSWFGVGSYYRRTQRAIAECKALLTALEVVVNGKVANGSVRTLITEINGTLAMPNLLRPGSWPTGTAAADVLPAETARGVTADGSESDLSTTSGANGDFNGYKF